MDAQPDVIVVSYRRPDLLDRCLSSARSQLPGAQIHVWDNRSNDSDAIRELAARHPDVDWHFCDENLGFAAAVNRLMARVEGGSALLLNPDAVLLSDLAGTRAALADPTVAAAAPRITDGDHRPWDNAHREPTLVRELVSYAGWDDRLGRRPLVSALYSDAPEAVSGYLTGACLLISMDAWRNVGTFDERYFLYGEEADWCARARRRGYVLRSVDEPGVEHSAGGTVSDQPTGMSRSRELLDENRRRYLTDHHGKAAGLVFAGVTAAMNRIQPSKARARAAHRAAAADDFVITTPTLDFGGAERQRVQLANALARRGFSVTLRVLQHSGGMADAVDSAVKMVVQDYRRVRRDAGPNTVLVTGTTKIEAAYGLAWRTLNRPHGRWVAANHTGVTGRQTFTADKRIMLRASDGIIYLANSHREEHHKQADLDRGRFWIIPNGVPVRAQAPTRRAPDGTVRFIVASRLEPFKQIDMLVRAFSQGMDHLDWSLDIWGDGPHREEIERAIPERLREHIRMRGWCSDVPGELARSDVYCMPSRSEAQPMVILEAMEAGICVASSPVASVPEVLQNGAGVLVDPPTEEQWRSIMQRLVTDVDFREETARAGRRRAQALYSIDAMTDRYVAMREEILGRH